MASLYSVFALLATGIPALAAGDFRDPDLPLDVRVSDLVSRLTLQEKISLMASTQPAIPRLGIEARNVGSEALHGVAYRYATVFPQATGLAHTWDPELIRAVGSAIGDEARVYHNDPNTKAGLQFWSPVVDLARDPRWGRTEEVYGEDPYLSAAIGGAFVRGMQGDDPRYYKTVPTLKHFAANSMENNRQSASSNVGPRNLREYYLKPFEKITREQQVQSYMVAYNAINDLPCAVTNLIRDVARGEWGFNGLIVTDAGDLTGLIDGHHYVSTIAQAAAAIVKAGMDSITDDQAIPAVQAAVNQGLLAESDLDLALRRNFRVRFLMGEFDPPEMVPFNTIPSSALMSPEHTALARRTGRESVVLLKNSQGLLPLDATTLKTVAVIGPRADEVERDWYAGYLPYKVTPVDGIRQRVGTGVQVLFHEGTSKIALKAHGNNRYLSAGVAGNAMLTAISINAGPGETFIAEDLGWGCTTLRSAVNGRYVTANYQGQFYASEENAYGWLNTFCFYFVPGPGGTAIQWLNYYLTVGNWSGSQLYLASSASSSQQAFDVVELENGTQRAAALAAQADVAVVVVGNNTTINGKEAVDRPDIILPPPQDDLIQAVYQANPKTVVVLVSSYPNAMNWEDQNVPSILYTSHGGQELGNFLADVLFGDYNPAGRLTMTWFQSAADLPPIEDFDIRKGRTYWYFQGQPLYPFGYGLSYTSFDYRNLAVTPGAAGPQDTIGVSLEVQNTGSRAGDEVVQLYVHARDSKVQRPLQELKRFQRIALQAGETRSVSFTLPVSEAAFWDVRRGKFTVEKGTLEIRVGGSSRDIRLHGEVRIDGDVLPPRNAFEVLRAENYDDYSGVLLTRAGDGTQAAGYIHDGDWLAFHEVDFGAGVTGMEARVSSGGGGGTIEVHLDRLDGPAAGVCAVPATGDWYTWTTVTCPNVQASGLHDTFLVFHGSGNGLFNLNWFRFASDSADAPTVDDGGAVDAAGYTQPLLRGSWGAVFGHNLASTTRSWNLTDFRGTTAPTSLDGTRVQVNGIAAAICFVMPTQVNFQVPDGVNIGEGVVQVITPAGASRPVRAVIDEAQPAFFAQVLGGRNWVTAQHVGYSRVGLPEWAPGPPPATPARPGETIILWGSGFGQTWPPIVPGLLVTAPLPLADPGVLKVTINGAPAAVQYGGMTMAGVYQLNVVVPDLPDGDHLVAATVGGRSTKVEAYLPVRR
ncbi:MAG: glycoside hydrolase family 3 C-terminal domain-containing protein [Bryobacteraceae bacterium]|jgi:beta-glucosidase